MTKQEVFEYVIRNSNINPNHFLTMLDLLLESDNSITDATATVNDLLKDKIAYNNSGKIIGTIEKKESQTYTPTTENQTISANIYLNGAQTILGDPNLLAENIKNGVTIFGVVGSYTGE